MPKTGMGPADGPAPMETAWLARDKTCGGFASGPRELVKQMVADHFLAHHPEVNPIVMGVDFEMYEAPFRCDMCSVPTEPPVWVHVTPEPINTAFTMDTDCRWTICQDCHRVLLERRPITLAKRMIAMHKIGSPFLFTDEAGTQSRVYFFEAATKYVELLDNGVLEGL